MGLERVPKHVPKSLEYVQARREAEENGNAVDGNRGGVDASTTGRHGGELVERNDETALAVHEALEVAARGEDTTEGRATRTAGRQGEETTEKTATQGNRIHCQQRTRQTRRNAGEHARYVGFGG